MGVPRAEAAAPSETAFSPACTAAGTSLQTAVDAQLFLLRCPAGRCAEHNCERVRMPALHAAPPMSKHLPGQQVQAHHGRLQQQVGVSFGSAPSSGSSWAATVLEAVPRGAADHLGSSPASECPGPPHLPHRIFGCPPDVTPSTSVTWTLPHPVCRCPLDICPHHPQVSPGRCPIPSTKCPLGSGSEKAQEPWARLGSEP